ncbi:N-acetylmuramoyl-L-alanine amidase [Oceanihabitans sp. IOP_32]|uniref:N-acetylmuramoyl-L-alanine amidase family protein n=1 Tax=Oceanihabitans sp. IOP_32 TaxID=2529032 RepID=UPI001293AA64|nr:N-acetylmuramoyl-L-alanine amidase [Oceanihabitans sp. IOP_32]QFZ53508.1 N-acetylmuramoyl-L-alanine amidase [Oceanihabitans sp. IOP_32]
MQTNKILVFLSLIVVFVSSSFTKIQDYQKGDKFIVVLDAGHGGRDPGTMGGGYKEKDIALKVVLSIGKELEKNPDIEVIYTRKKDVFVDLYKRGQIANKANADLFISVHCNSHNSQAHGAETFVLGTHRSQTNLEIAKKENSVILYEQDYEKNYGGFDPNSPESVLSLMLGQEEYLDQSIELAGLIQNKFTRELKRNDRKVKQAGFIVLHQTVMPSVLIELGFLSHKKEGAYLNSKKGQQEMALAIKDAILKYKNNLYLNVDNQFYVQDTPNSQAVEAVLSDVTFKIQIAASSKSIETKPYNFKGLNNISKVKENKLYRYFYGETSTYSTAKNLEAEVKQAGFKTGFIVAFKNGKKISLSEALKLAAN